MRMGRTTSDFANDAQRAALEAVVTIEDELLPPPLR
jgi:hypothetical protein